MEKYINKDILVAEIEKRMQEHHSGYLVCLKDILSFINTLEVKEIDLEKEIDNILNPRFNLGWDEKSLLSMNHEGFTTIAKYFFELGLKVQKENKI